MASDCLDTNSAPGSSARTHPGLLFSVVGDGILLGTCILLLSAQLFVRPFIGMADNGDFSKVTGRASLAPKFQVANFSYVVPVYIRSHKYRWSSEFLTSETLLAALASNLEKLTG